MSRGTEQVLALLREASGRPVSGRKLSDELSVTRAQVWKHMESLRKRGYEIEGEPGEGYRLAATPDRLYPEELRAGLETRWIAREIDYFDRLDSTNIHAQKRAREGAAAGTTVVAEAQTAGRGRLGRTFFSPAYSNLYTSVVLRPQLTTAEAPTLILAAAVAVADSVAQVLGATEEVEIKWPNDVLLGGLKTSGILMEMNAEATRVDYAVLGIGVNLNVERESFPIEFRHLATSLRSHCGRVIDRIDFARRLYTELEALLDLHASAGFAGVRDRFESYFRMRGRSLRVVEMNGDERPGVARGIAPDGALEIETPTGETRRVIAGDVTLAKENPAP